MKKHLRKIPRDIFAKLATIKGREVVVGCAVKFKTDSLAAGVLKHLGIVITPKGLEFPTSVLPPREQGKNSTCNVDGIEIIRKDLPKETHYRSFDVPNWGDWSNGSHSVDVPYEMYPREFVPPRELEIGMDCETTKPGLPAYVISFQVKETLDKTAADFEKRLFENLNLLQENVGACGVESADVALNAYAKSLHVSWEILPPGTLDETVNRVFRGKAPTQQQKDVVTERYKFFTSLKPKSLVYGTSGFRRYFGALLEDNLVLFENVEYGNAIYVLFDDWKELSKRSRVDLLSGKFGKDFERVVHTNGWKDAVKTIVAKRRNGGGNLI